VEKVKEIVICAAVMSTSGQIIRCHRHHDGFRTLEARGLKVEERNRGQGFITSRNRYVDRIKAFHIQLDAGIKSKAPGGYRGLYLYSEDLY
jgi:hypothetical protein